MISKKIMDKQKALLGEKPKDDGKRKKLGKQTGEEKKAAKEDKKEADAPTKTMNIDDIEGRDMNIKNKEKHLKALEAYKKKHNAKYFFRFPPEPNGYLHIGHAKAIRFNFTTAQENGGLCYLRFDDTNPCKENQEFIDHIKKNVNWLGYKPWKVTASSDYFQELYEFAVDLIKRDKAFVCHQTAEEMKHDREFKKNSPYRDRSVEENLHLFEKMKTGRMAEGECCLRVKMDMQHDNPNMRDFVAYRIRFVTHPHIGDKWCIYPTYDYTHCLVGSLEYITHSCCTLEFEIRRESYYELLKDCDVYLPKVWEYSRLNISNTVLSKRKIETLVNEGFCNSWSDPRLLTLEGLRKRGYTPSMINDFCKHIGVTRTGNENITSIKLLEKFARDELNAGAPRTFGVTEPLLLVISNIKDATETKFEAPLFPADPAKGT